MLSRPDFVEKQIVIITSDQVKDLMLRNDNLLIKENDKIVNQISCFKIFCIFIVGEYTLSTKLIDRMTKYQICIFCLGYSFKPRCMIGNPLQGNYLLRTKQYFSSEENDLFQAKEIVKNKIENQLFLLQEIRGKDDKLKQDIKKIKEILISVDVCQGDDSLRGLEGSVSKLFFAHYFKEIGRYKRMPRTRNDITNFLLDMGYSFLYNIIEAFLNLYGFDVYKGFYHKLFYERKSLACDMIEPLRCIVDKTIRKSYNLGQIKEKDFLFKNGEYELSWKDKKPYLQLFFQAILESKMDIFDYIKSYYRYIIAEKTDFPKFYPLNPK